MLDVIEWSAVIAFALYGVLRAHRMGFDAVGTVTLAFLVAFGGGTLRDVCLNRYPLFWIEQERYAVVVFALAIAGTLLPRAVERAERWLAVPDALGLGLYAVLGTQQALDAGVGWLVAAVMGVVTGTFGGVFADVVGNQTPSIFRHRSPLYATCAFAGAWCYLLLHALGWPRTALIAGIALTVLLRALGLRRGWSLPCRAPSV